MSETNLNCYLVLDIAPTATDAQIRAAFRRTVLRWHPDQNGNSRESQEITMRAKEACDLLLNPARRRAHDACLWNVPAPACAPEPARSSGGAFQFLYQTLTTFAAHAKSHGKINSLLSLRRPARPQMQAAIYGHFVLS